MHVGRVTKLSRPSPGGRTPLTSLAPALAAAAALLLLAACPEPRRSEVASRLEQDARLQEVGYPLLAGATPLCDRGALVGRLGVLYANAPSFPSPLHDAARKAGLGDTVSVTHVLGGSGAARAGLQPGDRLIRIDDKTLAVGTTAVAELSAWLAARERTKPAAYRVTYRRERDTATVKVDADQLCDYRLVLVPSDEVEAVADGWRRVFVTTGMLRFAERDGELATVVAHEIAHDAMRHVTPPSDSASAFSQLRGTIFPSDVEREADYVGTYVAARAGWPAAEVTELWRHLASRKPGTVAFAASHPGGEDRFAWLQRLVAEIEGKQAAGLALVPDVRRPAAPRRGDAGEVVAVDIGRPSARGARRGAVASADRTRAAPATQGTPRAAYAATPSSVPPTPAEPRPAGPLVPVDVSVRAPGWIVGSFMYIPRYPLLVVDQWNDSTLVRTDEEGNATLRLRPGRYRVIPARRDRVAERMWFEWDVPFEVRPGMRALELSPANGRWRRE